MMSKLLSISLLLLINSCTKELKEKYSTQFSELPVSVQNEFEKIGNSENMFMVANNTNADCETDIRSGNPIQAIMPQAYMIIETCKESYKVSFSITSARFFVIDGDKIYFTKSNGFSMRGDVPLNESLEMNNVPYGVIELK